jgi:hypothetical protein
MRSDMYQYMVQTLAPSATRSDVGGASYCWGDQDYELTRSTHGVDQSKRTEPKSPRYFGRMLRPRHLVGIVSGNPTIHGETSGKYVQYVQPLVQSRDR